MIEAGVYDVTINQNSIDLFKISKTYYLYLVANAAAPFIIKVPPMLNETNFLQLDVENMESIWHPDSNTVEIIFTTITDEEVIVDALYKMTMWFEQVDNWKMLINNNSLQPNVKCCFVTTERNAPVELFRWDIDSPDLLWCTGEKGIPSVIYEYMSLMATNVYDIQHQFPSLQRVVKSKFKIKVGDYIAYLHPNIELSQQHEFIYTRVIGIDESAPCWVVLQNNHHLHLLSTGVIDVALYDPVNMVLLSSLESLESYKV